MQDILLWRELNADRPSLPEEELAARLEELASQPVEIRRPFFPLLDDLLRRTGPRARAAALKALAGAAGYPAFKCLAAGLDDPDREVRRAAVAALCRSAEADPARYVHALFHPDPEVRALALAQPPPREARWYSILLLGDDRLWKEAFSLLQTCGWSYEMIDLLLEAAYAGFRSREEIREILRQFHPNDIVKVSIDREEKIDLRDLLFRAFGDRPVLPPPEAVGGRIYFLFDLFWDELAAEAGPGWDLPGSLARRLRPPESFTACGKIAWSLIQLCRVRGEWPPALAGLIALAEPLFFGYEWIPPEIRRRAAGWLYELSGYAGYGTRFGPEYLSKLRTADIYRRPSGRIDLRVAGGLAGYMYSRPLRVLAEAEGIEAIAAAVRENPDDLLPFLLIDNTRDRGGCLAGLFGELKRDPALDPLLLLDVELLFDPELDLDADPRILGLDSPSAVKLTGRLLGCLSTPGYKYYARRSVDLGPALAGRIGREGFRDFLRLEAGFDPDRRVELAREVFRALAGLVPPADFAEVVSGLPLLRLRAVLPWVGPGPDGPGREALLAEKLLSHPDPEMHLWARAHAPGPVDLPLPEGEAWREAAAGKIPALSPAERDRIAACPLPDLKRAVAPCLVRPRRGLTEALARRPDPGRPVEAAVRALFLSYDPLTEIDRELVRFAGSGEGFAAGLVEFLRRLHPVGSQPLQFHAVFSEREEHFDAFREIVLCSPGGLAAFLEAAAGLRSEFLREMVWETVVRLFRALRWREPKTFPSRCGEELVGTLERALFNPCAPRAAEVLVTIQESGAAPALMAGLRERLLPRVRELDEETRRVFRFWLNPAGLPPSAGRAGEKLDPEALALSSDVTLLERACRGADPAAVLNAGRRLAELGEEGTAALLGLLRGRESASIPRPDLVCSAVRLWPEGEHLAELRRLIRGEGLSPRTAMYAALGLADRGEKDFLTAALAAPLRETGEPYDWFRGNDYRALLKSGIPEIEAARFLASSPQAGAYMPAVGFLLRYPSPGEAEEEALVRFLESGSGRSPELRLRAALRLLGRGNSAGLPLLIGELLRPREDGDRSDAAELPARFPDRALLAAVRALLYAGFEKNEEGRLAAAILSTTVLEKRDSGFAEEVALAFLRGSTHQEVRDLAARALLGSRRREGLVRKLAEIHAWGVTIGQELTSRVFQIRIADDGRLGYTSLETDTIYVSPIPAIKGEPHGRAVVEGLILHELGHHLYHADDDSRAQEAKARDEKIFYLLNLVRDEHLERRLRSRDPAFGHRFKKLEAYVFSHSDSEFEIRSLIQTLGLKAGPPLGAYPLAVARNRGCVLAAGGRLLREIERRGSSFARFIRALRMGLGDRHGDPRVAEALGLFRGRFRDSPPAELLRISRELARIFADERRLFEDDRKDRLLREGKGEARVLGEGINDEELRDEVDRRLGPGGEKRDGSSGPPAGRYGAFINLGPDEKFKEIRQVVRLEYSREGYLELVRRLGRLPARLRRNFERLGLGLERQPLRTSGRRVDRSRLPAAVTRGDPRLLSGRRPVTRTDLFLGLLVDCSGSMMIADRIERARLFAVLLSEAARGVPGIDVRIFGFNDWLIFDAGDARRCAAAALRCGGGNNDAGALWYAAKVARASRRKARLLVMISDGSPTECTVNSLRRLVNMIQSRMAIACAQVAVRTLDEICFPHYIDLQENSSDRAVLRFGPIIARLVRKTLRGAR